MFLAYLLTAYP